MHGLQWGRACGPRLKQNEMETQSRSEMGRKGGSVTTEQSLAKADAVGKAHQARASAVRERRSALQVPEPFSSAEDFLRSLAGIARALPRQPGGEIARLCNVSTSTVSKWLRGAKVPTQANLDKLITWWRSNRQHAESSSAAAAAPHIKRTTPTVSLSRLPEAIGSRLRKAARLRNVDPITLAGQILDRQLPSLEEMDLDPEERRHPR